MPTYLIEAYMPRSHAQEARAASRRARAAAEELSSEGVPIRYIRTTFLPDDETCFHLFEAVSANAVEEVSRRAELGRSRVVPYMPIAWVINPRSREPTGNHALSVSNRLRSRPD